MPFNFTPHTGRVIAHRIERGLALLGWFSLAWIGSTVATFAVGVDLLRQMSASAHHAEQIDAALLRMAQQLHAPAPSAFLLAMLVAGIALLVWALCKIAQWFRHSEKRN
jgi:hypothetical protein